jgi:hypothetical protein
VPKIVSTPPGAWQEIGSRFFLTVIKPNQEPIPLTPWVYV